MFSVGVKQPISIQSVLYPPLKIEQNSYCYLYILVEIFAQNTCLLLSSVNQLNAVLSL